MVPNQMHGWQALPVASSSTGGNAVPLICRTTAAPPPLQVPRSLMDGSPYAMHGGGQGPRQGLEADSICGTWAVEWFQRLCQKSWEEWQAGMQVRLSLLPRAQLPGLVIPSDAGGGD